MNYIIITEANFLEKMLYEVYEEKGIDDYEWKTIKLRLQSIRDEAQKEDDKDSARS